jgi:hypothetical protein
VAMAALRRIAPDTMHQLDAAADPGQPPAPPPDQATPS